MALATACASEPAVEPAGPISVALSSDSAVLPAGGRKDFTVTVANDQGGGVAWSIRECAGGPAACGSLTNVTRTTVTYNAPTPVPAPARLGVTATSVADPTKSATASVFLVPIGIDLSPGSLVCAAVNGARQRLTGIVWKDLTHSGVTWGVTGCMGGPRGCGTVTDVTSSPAPANYDPPATLISATYTAPLTVPPGAFGVTATSVADPTKSSTATVAIYAAPVGDQIAFESWRDDYSQIYVMNSDGSGVANLTNNSTTGLRPVWSRDGAKIAFDAYGVIGVMGADCSAPVPLVTTEDLLYSSPSWSPDGTKIAFVSFEGDYAIRVVNADGSGVTTWLTTGGYSPTWSPVGVRISFRSYRDGNWEIYAINADGLGLVNLTNNPAGDDSPVWSPDGAKIAFESTRDGNAEIYVMNADGSGPTRLTNDPASDIRPIWSPDGAKIAFESTRDGNAEIYVMNADGSAPTRLTNSPGSDLGPAWSPDGSKIAFASDRDGNGEIYVMNADGSMVRNLTNNTAIDRAPAWRPR